MEILFLYIQIKNKMRKGNNYWTKERCQKEALKYNSRSEFRKHSMGAYSASKNRYKCLDEICLHMELYGNKYKRCIYVYEFFDNHAYIGLTFNLKKRHLRHLIKGTVCEYIKKMNNYELKQLTPYIDVNEAIKLENQFVQEYEKNKWLILNKAKTGSVGGYTRKWDKESCRKEALKYLTKKEFCIKNSGAYRSSLHNGWLNEICSHMTNRNEWNKENCRKEALKYTSRFKFSKGSKPAYMSALNNGWLDELCYHMGEKIKKRDIWSYDECKKEASKYKNRGQFSIKSPYPYKLSRINNWLNEFFPKK